MSNNKDDKIYDFPFRTHQEFVESINSGSSTIGIEYTSARGLVNTSKLKSRIILFNGMIWLPNVLILLSVVLSIYTSNWFLLLGIISAILGQLFANPYNH